MEMTVQLELLAQRVQLEQMEMTVQLELLAQRGQRVQQVLMEPMGWMFQGQRHKRYTIMVLLG
jgi:hypothetical protein